MKALADQIADLEAIKAYGRVVEVRGSMLETQALGVIVKALADRIADRAGFELYRSVKMRGFTV